MRIRIEHRRQESRELFEIARLQAALLINYNGIVLKSPITDPRKLMSFNWENKEKEQTVKEMKAAILKIATVHNAKEGKRNIDDPPTILAPIHRK